MDGRQDMQVEGYGDGGRYGYRQHGKKRRRHGDTGAACRAGSALVGVMTRRRRVIGMPAWCDMFAMWAQINNVRIGGHCFVVMIRLRRNRQRRAQGHRCGSEAMKWHRQQRDPDDHNFKNGFHELILAYARVS